MVRGVRFKIERGQVPAQTKHQWSGTRPKYYAQQLENGRGKPDDRVGVQDRGGRGRGCGRRPFEFPSPQTWADSCPTLPRQPEKKEKLLEIAVVVAWLPREACQGISERHIEAVDYEKKGREEVYIASKRTVFRILGQEKALKQSSCPFFWQSDKKQNKTESFNQKLWHYKRPFRHVGGLVFEIITPIFSGLLPTISLPLLQKLPSLQKNAARLTLLILHSREKPKINWLSE